MQYQASSQYINTHRIEMLMLAIMHISAWACLIKSDPNFVLIFFTYFYIVSRKDNVSVSIIFYTIILLLFMDILFFLFVPSSWMTYQQKNTVWNNLHSMHGFAIFCSVIVFAIKIPLAYLLYAVSKELKGK